VKKGWVGLGWGVEGRMWWGFMGKERDRGWKGNERRKERESERISVVETETSSEAYMRQSGISFTVFC